MCTNSEASKLVSAIGTSITPSPERDPRPRSPLPRARSREVTSRRTERSPTPSVVPALRAARTSPSTYVRSSITSAGRPWSAASAANCSMLIGDVLDLAAGGLGDLRRDLGVGERPGPGELVELPDMAVVGQRSDRDVGDVLYVQVGDRPVASRPPDLTAQDVVDQEVLAEVLHEPRGPQHMADSAPVADGPLGPLVLGLRAGPRAAPSSSRPCSRRARRTRGSPRPRRGPPGPGSTSGRRRRPRPGPAPRSRGPPSRRAGFRHARPRRTGRPAFRRRARPPGARTCRCRRGLGSACSAMSSWRSKR